MFTGDDIPQISFIVFLLCKNFHARHQQIIVAEKLLENKAAEGIAEAFVGLRIECDDFHLDVESLACRSRKTKKTVFKGICWMLKCQRDFDGTFSKAKTYTRPHIGRRGKQHS